MRLIDKLDAISEIKVNTEIKNDTEICSAILYSIYFLYNNFPNVFDKSGDIYADIKSTIYDNLVSINNGADKVMTFYFLNKEKIQKTDFCKIFEKYLNLLSDIKEYMGEYSSINVYKTLVDKIALYEERYDRK